MSYAARRLHLVNYPAYAVASLRNRRDRRLRAGSLPPPFRHGGYPIRPDPAHASSPRKRSYLPGQTGFVSVRWTGAPGSNNEVEVGPRHRDVQRSGVGRFLSLRSGCIFSALGVKHSASALGVSPCQGAGPGRGGRATDRLVCHRWPVAFRLLPGADLRCRAMSRALPDVAGRCLGGRFVATDCQAGTGRGSFLGKGILGTGDSWVGEVTAPAGIDT